MHNVFLILLLLSCSTPQEQATVTPSANVLYHNTTPQNISGIPLPAGYVRTPALTASFAAWLRQVPLKEDKTVYLFNGEKKQNQSAQYAVLNVLVGNKDLQQCADAVMRLRAEYLFAQQQFDKIVFTDNAGKKYSLQPPYTRSHFDSYLASVFGMCGSASLAKQLHTVPMQEVLAGDVFIRGGFPGHAVLVMDVAIGPQGNKIFLLAQSYMPAQDIHVLVNPADAHLSPWYALNNEPLIVTPEYVFKSTELKRW